LPKNNFKITAEELKRHIDSKTKAIILNSPSNPTGAVYNIEDLSQIAKICVENKIFVISDEIYEKLIYDNLKHVSIAGLGQDIYGLTITVNGLSKSFSMTGWRIGYLAGPVDVVEAISKLQDHSTSNPTSISQKAGVAALSEPDDFSRKMCEEFQRRRDYAIERLKQIKKINFTVPQGAFYIFCDISKTGLDSLTFANRLLEEALVALIPGAGFGRDDYIRISFATNLEELEKGMDRIASWLDKL
jgi:aspartate aminotransferase